MSKPKDWSAASFRTLDEFRAELDAIDAAERAGTLRATGGWSAGQILEHCAIMMRFSFDGFEGVKAPRVLRVLGSAILKPRLATSQIKPGLRLPSRAAGLLPPGVVAFGAGMASLRGQIGRIDAGERMTQASPVLGRMTHEQWVLLHLNHCRMHFGFLKR